LIYVQDDVFGFEMNWLRKFIPRYRDEVAIPFHAQLRLELASGDLGRERLALMKLGGCTGVTVAVESGSYDVRKDILDRPMKDTHIVDGCRNVRDAGLTLRTEQMLGIPTRTTRPGGSALHVDLLTLELNVLLRPEIAWSAILAPYGGTELGKLCADLGLYSWERLATNDDVCDSFFDESALAYGPLYKHQVRVLQRLFSLLAHVDWGHIIAERFLNEALPRFSDREIHEFATLAKELAKRTKVLLYDSELYRTKDERLTNHDNAGVSGTNDKSRDELLADAGGAPLTLEDLALQPWSAEQRAVLEALSPLWRYLPRGEVAALHLLEHFPTRPASERTSFLAIASELGRIARAVAQLGPMDHEAEIRRRTEDEQQSRSRKSADHRQVAVGEETSILEVTTTNEHRPLRPAAADHR
jgi:hypothetical protein